ncbi:hypothetical protein EST38_g7113 [Candolleomyces aberdarensis]|uniref:Uncharacterized protein n=1 Tax=Candolleomyces aberdarensis TaxID=2316362 RepID=A0A4Q2DFZ2_9AGAR|nr:hypothetical protein EST38_g7113 [Candolleomyces aberdarensis]
MLSNDAHVARLTRDALIVAKRENLSTVACALIASNCTNTHIVPVPVDRGFESLTRPIDIDLDLYLDIFHDREPSVVDLDEIMHEIPTTSAFAASYGWTVFMSTHRTPNLNTLVTTFPRSGLIAGPVYGSFIVVKSSQSGAAVDVVEGDLSIVKDVLVDRALVVIARAKAAFRSSPPIPKANFVFNMSEMLSCILQYCDHSTVMSISRLNRHGRLHAQSEIRLRVRLLLLPFVPKAAFASFMDMLNDTGAVIMGSVARHLFTINSIFIEDLKSLSFLSTFLLAVVPYAVMTGAHRELYTSCADLNLAVPPGRHYACIAWFTEHGYSSWTALEDRKPISGLAHVANSYTCGHKDIAQSKY